MSEDPIDKITGREVFVSKSKEPVIIRARGGKKALITESDVKRACGSGGVIYVTGEYIITPFAQDLIKGTGVRVELVQDQESKEKLEPIPPDCVKSIAIGSDHRGYALKEELKNFLLKEGYRITDVGTNKPERCDYPDFASAVARLVSSGNCERGIMIDSTGIASTIVVNKFKGIRGALCHTTDQARSSREHTDTNVLVLAGDLIAPQLAKEIVNIWLKTPFLGGHYAERLKKIKLIEEGN